MANKYSYDNPPQMADYVLNEEDIHHCGEDANEEVTSR